MASISDQNYFIKILITNLCKRRLVDANKTTLLLENKIFSITICNIQRGKMKLENEKMTIKNAKLN